MRKTKRKAVHHIEAITIIAFDNYRCGISPSLTGHLGSQAEEQKETQADRMWPNLVYTP